MIGSNSTAALTFHDPVRLAKFWARCKPNRMSSARAFTTRMVKSLRHIAGSVDSCPAGQPDGSKFVARNMVLFQNIVLNGDSIGTIYLEADLKDSA